MRVQGDKAVILDLHNADYYYHVFTYPDFQMCIRDSIINVRPLTWPIESGPRFKGVYNLYEHKLNLFQPSKQVVTEKVGLISIRKN